MPKYSPCKPSLRASTSCVSFMVESFRVLDAHGAARFERATSAALSKMSNTSSKPSPVVAMRLEPTTKRVYRMASPSLRSTSAGGLSAPQLGRCEQCIESLCHRRMRENGVTEQRVRQPAEDRRLHRSHHLPRLGAKHGEPENAVPRRFDQHLHRAGRLARGVRPEDGGHRELRNTYRDPSLPGLRLGHADACQRGVREQTKRHETVARTAIPPGQVVADDPKVIEGDVCELGAAGTLPHRPYVGRRRLEPMIHLDVAPR